MGESQNSGFGDSAKPRGRRKLERRAEEMDHNPVLNITLKALNVLSSALLAIGLWYIQDLKTEIKETRNDVRAAVISINKIESSTNELGVRMRSLEEYRTAAEGRGREIDRRVTAAETDIKHLQTQRMGR